MKKQKVNIYYHSDLDGIFSAIMIAKSYVDNNIECKFNFFPVNYDIKNWQESVLPTADSIIIVDFMFHQQCSQFYDHHLSGWGEEEPREFKGRYDSSAPSCCHVIFNDPLRLRFKDEHLIKQIVDGINICDYALYTYFNEPYDITKWYSAMRMSLMEDGSSAYMDELIKLFLYNEPVLKRLVTNIIPEISQWRAYKNNFATLKGFKVFERCYKYENKVVHFTIPPYEKFDRYFPFKAENDAMYTVYIRDSTWANPSKCFISVSKNPWIKKDNTVSIKEICEKYQFSNNSRGGGHLDVGGIVTDTMEEALQCQKEIVSLLQNSVIEFEKKEEVATF